ncbi:Pex12 amino terminal region-domain-containing protein [Phakopsora pachyrhizi]|nr:Pex12 amino terminal region-domain-containing protein [Phakopsora pachyrhizi]
MKDLQFPDGAQPEIIRAEQRDGYFIESLREQFEPILMNFKGVRWVNSRTNEIQEFCRLIYFGLTTLPGTQTLGEEYCDIIQISSFTEKIPSILHRLNLIFLQVFSKRILTKLYRSAYRKILPLISITTSTSPSNQARSSAKLKLLSKIKSLLLYVVTLLPTSLDTTILNNLNVIHLALFYLTGRYFKWSKRFTGIRYVSNRLRPLSEDGKSRTNPPSYEILGFLMIVQLLIKLIQSHRNHQRQQDQLKASSSPTILKGKQKDSNQTKLIPMVDGTPINKIQIEQREEEEEGDTFEKVSNGKAEDHDDGVEKLFRRLKETMNLKRCILCLSPKKDQTSLECGHVFCWICILNWVREKPECPLCRQSVKVSQLLPIYNF